MPSWLKMVLVAPFWLMMVLAMLYGEWEYMMGWPWWIDVPVRAFTILFVTAVMYVYLIERRSYPG